MAEAMSPDLINRHELQFQSNNLVTMFENGKWNVKMIQRRSEIKLIESIINMTHDLGMAKGASKAEGTEIKLIESIINMSHELCMVYGGSKAEGTEIKLIESIINMTHELGVVFGGSKAEGTEIKTIESIMNMTHEVGVVYGGSKAEGTDIEGSDADYMLIVPRIHVVGEACEGKELKGHVFLMREDGHRPCYPSLQLLSKDADYGLISVLGGIEKFLEEGKDGAQYLSSEMFASELQETFADVKDPKKAKTYRHGPCTTFVMNSVSSQTHEHDTVYTIPCKTWPTEAEEWINRPRPKGWPTPDVVHKVVQTGCTLVPLGNPSSDDRHIEWRISFLLGERELMWRLNNCQYYCFITLKYILKMHLDKLFPDKISTFHMKTILFWISEDQGLEYWREENIFQCIRDCLHRLLKCIKDKKMRHYFARRNNILSGKLDSADERNKLASEIQFVISNVVEVVHCCFGFKCQSGECQLHRRILYEYSSHESDSNSPIQSFCDYVLPYSTKIHLREQLDKNFRRLTPQQLIMVRKEMKNLPEDIMEEQKSFASDILDALLGVYLQQASCFPGTGLETEYFDGKIHTAETLLLKGRKTDAMAGKLQLATFYYMRENMDQAKVWINNANTQEGAIFYSGRCSRTKIIRTKDNPNKKTAGDLNVAARSVTYACDVKYHPNDLVCLPKPLQYECALFDDVNDDLLIHPVVYSETLSVLVHIAQGNVNYALAAVHDLASTVENNKGDFHDIALNLLGYCYSLVGEVDQALDCFYLSYQERRSVSYYPVQFVASWFVKVSVDK